MSQWAICVPVWRFLYHVIIILQRAHPLVYIKSLLNNVCLKLDFKMVSFLLKFGERKFSLCKLAFSLVLIHVYSFWKKKILTLIKNNELAVSDVVGE